MFLLVNKFAMKNAYNLIILTQKYLLSHNIQLKFP